MGGSNSSEEKQVAEQAEQNVDRTHLHSLSPTSALLHPKQQVPQVSTNQPNKKINDLQQQQPPGKKKNNEATTAPTSSSSKKDASTISAAAAGGNNSSSSPTTVANNNNNLKNDENLKSFISCIRGPPRVPLSLNLDPIMAGLVNYGNTCYANSVLQMLFHTPAFRHHISERFAQQIADLTSKSNGEVPVSYVKLYSSISNVIMNSQQQQQSPSSVSSSTLQVSLKSFTPPSEIEVAAAKKLLCEWKETIWFEMASLFSRITEASEKVSKKAKDELIAAAINSNNSNETSNNNNYNNNIPTVPCPIGISTVASSIGYKFPVVEPVEMLKRVRATYFQFNNREQHDAHEFALTLLNTLFEEEAKFIANLRRNNGDADETATTGDSPASPSSALSGPYPSTSSPTSNLLPPPFAALFQNINNNNNIVANQEKNSSSSLSSCSSPLLLKKEEIKLNAGNLQTTLRSMTGKTVTLTSCLECDTMTSVTEDLVDVSCVLEPKSSLRYDAEAFTNHEILTGENKFRCDCCGSSCVARRRTIVSTPAPKMLLLQIKRFRYSQNGVTKLNDFVPFSDRLRVPVYDAQNNIIGSQLYRLCAFVVHMGSYPMAGHYFCIAHHRTTKQWMILNDEKTSIISERERMKFLGTCPDLFSADQGNNVTAYVLSYEKDDDFDESLELEKIEAERQANLRKKQQRRENNNQKDTVVGAGVQQKGNRNSSGAKSSGTNRRYDADVIV